MERNMEKVRVEQSKVKFVEKLIQNLDKINKQELIKVVATGAEGPMVAFIQNNEKVLFLQVFHGKNHNYTPEFISLAKETLKEHNYRVE